MNLVIPLLDSFIHTVLTFNVNPLGPLNEALISKYSPYRASSVEVASSIRSNFPVHPFFFEALFDNGDFFAGEAVKGIDKLVDLGVKGGNIRALNATVARLSCFRRRCNKSILTLKEFRKRRSVCVLVQFDGLRTLKG